MQKFSIIAHVRQYDPPMARVVRTTMDARTALDANSAATLALSRLGYQVTKMEVTERA